MSLFKEVYEMCKKIPSGRVATYGQIAILIGRPRCARQVGWALNRGSKRRKCPLAQSSKQIWRIIQRTNSRWCKNAKTVIRRRRNSSQRELYSRFGQIHLEIVGATCGRPPFEAWTNKVRPYRII